MCQQRGSLRIDEHETKHLERAAFLTPITDSTNTIVVKTLLVEINLETVAKIVADFDERVIGEKYVYLVDNHGRVIVTAEPTVVVFSEYPALGVQPGLLDNFSQQGEVGSAWQKTLCSRAEAVLAD